MADLKSSRTTTSALYAIASSAFYFLGPATGSVGDRLGSGVITGFGALLMAGDLAATAFVTDISIAYLTYGFGVGIGAACAYIPTFAVVGGWFDKWRTRALSIAATGTGFGMLALPPFCAAIIQHFGWRTAALTLAAISGAAPSWCTQRRLGRARRRERPWARHCARERSYRSTRRGCSVRSRFSCRWSTCPSFPA